MEAANRCQVLDLVWKTFEQSSSLNAMGQRDYFADKCSFCLATLERNTTTFLKPKGETLGSGYLRTPISRCRVCIKSTI